MSGSAGEGRSSGDWQEKLGGRAAIRGAFERQNVSTDPERLRTAAGGCSSLTIQEVIRFASDSWPKFWTSVMKLMINELIVFCFFPSSDR